MNKLLRQLLFILPAIALTSVSAQTFTCYISNDHLVSTTQYDLDVYLISTSTDFNLRTIQNCIVFNPAFIPNGATITVTLLAGSSQLNSYSIGPISWSATGYGFQTSANLGSSCQTGTLITTSTPVRVGTFRLESTLPFNCVPSYPNMLIQGDPSPPGLALKMSVSKWNSTDCLIGGNTAITFNGTYSQYIPQTAYDSVNNMHPVITLQPLPASNCGTGYVTFEMAASGSSFSTTPVSFQWLENGMPVTDGATANGVYSGSSTNTLTINSPSVALSGNVYSCIVLQCNSDTTTEVELTVSNTNDNDVCTTDFCDPVTGALSHTPITGINDNNACTADACNSISGNITHQAVNTNDNDACSVDGCNTSTGIFHTYPAISDNNPCTTDGCNSVSGIVSHDPVSVDDNNACTVDACNSLSGAIQHTTVNTSDNNQCTLDACDPLTGNVSHTPLNISDNNGCTVDACNSISGVSHTSININDNDACTLDYCNSVTGSIYHFIINVNDNDACTTDGCSTSTGVYHIPPSINDNDACTADACNSANGVVTHAVININDNDACTTDGCSSISGVYHIPSIIEDNNACTADACNSLSGVITHAVINTNDNDACTTDGCDTGNGVFHVPFVIDDNIVCTEDACNSLTGLISHIDITPSAPVITVVDTCGYSLLIAGGITGSVTWSNSSTATSITTLTPGTFTATQEFNGCVSMPGSGTASPKTVPVVFLGNDTLLSSAVSLTLDAGAGFAGYVWSNGLTTQTIVAQTSGVYAVTVTSQNGCSASDTIQISFSVGVSNPAQSKTVSIYPNPSNNSIFISLENSEAVYKMEIYNAIGERVNTNVSFSRNGDAEEINVSNLTQGIYSIVIDSSKGRRTGFFVKQ